MEINQIISGTKLVTHKDLKQKQADYIVFYVFGQLKYFFSKICLQISDALTNLFYNYFCMPDRHGRRIYLQLFFKYCDSNDNMYDK